MTLGKEKLLRYHRRYESRGEPADARERRRVPGTTRREKRQLKSACTGQASRGEGGGAGRIKKEERGPKRQETQPARRKGIRPSKLKKGKLGVEILRKGGAPPSWYHRTGRGDPDDGSPLVDI